MEENNNEKCNYNTFYFVNHKFAHELYQQGIAAGNKFYQVINHDPEYNIYSQIPFCITGSSSYSNAYSAAQYYWRQAFPDNYNDVEIAVFKADDSEASRSLNSMYKNLFGFENFLRVCTQLYNMLPFYKGKENMKNLLSMNYLVAIDNGCGLTEMTDSFCYFNAKLNVIEKAEYFEIKIDKESKNGYDSVDDAISIVEKEDNFGTFITFDICYFLAKERHDELRSFINRLYKYQNKHVFMFRVPYLEKEAYQTIHEIISDVISIVDITIPPLDDITLLQFASDTINNAKYSIEDKVNEIFLEKVQEEKRDGRFYGFKTASKIINEMIWFKTKRDAENQQLGLEFDSNKITAKDLEGFCQRDFSNEKSGYEELAELVGMEKITNKVKEIVAQVKASINNEKLDRPCIHMRFLGSPGTGKTTVARIVGKILKEEGILRKGNFIECSARSLCGEYVGQTAPKTLSICRDAYGSVLFIDEAYSLYTGGDSKNDYGKEALATLIAEMENHRTDMVVIMAGYTQDMETLMEGNIGLRSRMPYTIDFDNYSQQKLFEIFMSMTKRKFEYADDFEQTVKAYFDSIPDSYIRAKEFANARFVRNLFERTWSKAALRAAFTNSNEISLIAEDFRSATQEKDFMIKTEPIRSRVGY